VPAFNIRAAIGYLLMRAANYAIKNIPDADTKTYEVKVKPGDSLDRISRQNGTTIETFRRLNPTVGILHPGDILKYQKAAMKKVIVGWKPLTTASIATLYNVGDSMYAKKLDYALAILKQKKAVVCAQ
jgi:LysM domain